LKKGKYKPSLPLTSHPNELSCILCFNPFFKRSIPESNEGNKNWGDVPMEVVCPLREREKLRNVSRIMVLKELIRILN
jgi:hypothetical protein